MTNPTSTRPPPPPPPPLPASERRPIDRPTPGDDPRHDRRGRLLARYADRPPWAVVTQVFFGLGWLRAVGEKVISVEWWTGDTVRAFVAEHAGATLPWFEPVLDLAVLPAAALVALAVLVAEAAVGLAFLANRRVGPALVAAGALNLAFIATGAVNPSAFYLVGQAALALWLVGRRRPTATLSRGLQLVTGVGVALAAVSAPFITTLHPAAVIDDPAIMVTMLGGLTALATELTHRALFRRGLP